VCNIYFLHFTGKNSYYNVFNLLIYIERSHDEQVAVIPKLYICIQDFIFIIALHSMIHIILWREYEFFDMNFFFLSYIDYIYIYCIYYIMCTLDLFLWKHFSILCFYFYVKRKYIKSNIINFNYYYY